MYSKLHKTFCIGAVLILSVVLFLSVTEAASVIAVTAFLLAANVYLYSRGQYGSSVDMIYLFFVTVVSAFYLQSAVMTEFPGESVISKPNLNAFFWLIHLGLIFVLPVALRKRTISKTDISVVIFVFFLGPFYTQIIDKSPYGLMVPAALVIERLMSTDIKEDRRYSSSIFASAGFLFVLWLFISGLFADDTGGMFRVFSHYAAPLAALPLLRRTKNGKRNTWLWGLFFLFIVTLLISFNKFFYNWFALHLRNFWHIKLWTAAVHPNALASFLIALLPFLCAFITFNFKKKWRIISYFLLGFIMLLLVFLTRSRGGVIALSGMLIAAPLLLKKPKSRAFQIIFTIALLIPVLFFSVYSVGSLRLESGAGQQFEGIRDRIILWKPILRAIGDIPAFGLGMGNHHRLSQWFQWPDLGYRELYGTWIGWDMLGRHSHQVFLEILLIGGVPALILFLLVTFYALFKGRRGIHNKDFIYRTMGKAALLSLLFQGLFDFTWYYPCIILLFWTAAASAAGEFDQAALQPAFLRLMTRRLQKIFLLIFFFTAVLVPIVNGLFSNLQEVWDQDAPLKVWSMLMPWNPAPERLLGERKLEEKQSKEALDHFRKAVERDPSTLNDHAVLGWLMIRLREDQKGFEYLMMRERKDPLGTVCDPYIDLAAFVSQQDAQNKDDLLHYLEKSFMVGAGLKENFFWDNENERERWCFSSLFLGDYLAEKYGILDLPKVPQGLSVECSLELPEVLSRLQLNLKQEQNREVYNDYLRIKTAELLWESGYRKKCLEILQKGGMSLKELHGFRDVPIDTIEEDSPEQYRIEGTRLLALGKPEEALPFLERAWENGLDDLRISAGLAEAYKATGNIDEAVKHYYRIIEQQPENETIRNNLALLLLHQRRYNKAEHQFNEALKINPRSYSALYNLGTLYLATNQPEKAAEMFDRCLKLDPSSPAALFNRARAADKMNRSNEALVFYRHFLASAKPDTYNELRGIAVRRINALQKAAEGNSE